MVMPPHLSSATYLSGTPVSVMSMTSKRQQFALHVAQVTSLVGRFLTSIVIIYHVPSLVIELIHTFQGNPETQPRRLPRGLQPSMGDQPPLRCEC